MFLRFFFGILFGILFGVFFGVFFGFLFGFLSCPCSEAILNAGDVLYIPPMWFHHVTTLEESVSLSVWSPFAGSELYAKVLAEAPLPIKGSWEDEMKVAGTSTAP